MSEESTQATNDAMVGAAIAGDRQAMQGLWHAHRRWIAAVLLMHKPRSVDLEDLLQEVAMTLVSKIDTLRAETNVRAWLRVVAINAARASARSLNAKPKIALGEQDIPDDSMDAVERSAGSEHAQRVMDLAHRLPEAYREPLMLRALHGMRSREIADVLGIPPATVDTRVARARRMLREMMDGDDNCGADSDAAPARLALDRDRTGGQP